jgi:peptidyl-prolyl cis-trans isomerase SurA
MEGEDFGTLAVLYSEDGSAPNEGEIGFMAKAELDQEYAKAAFSLKVGGISKIVESEFGYHLIQLIARKDDRVNTRHILMKPKISLDARQKAISKLDSIADLIKKDSITFEKAVRLYSQDKNTVLSNGLAVNPATNSSKFELKQLDTKDYLAVRDMKPGDLSNPYESVDDKGKTLYKIVMLKSKSLPHKANLEQDYLLIQSKAMEEKMNKTVDAWIREKQAETYIYIDPAISACEFISKGWLVVEN